MRAKYI